MRCENMHNTAYRMTYVNSNFVAIFPLTHTATWYLQYWHGI